MDLTVDLTGNPKDKITQEEFTALSELKHSEDSASLTDKQLMIFLFHKKLNVKEARIIMEKNLKWRKENGYLGGVKRSQLNEELLQSMYTFWLFGARDKEGRLISYLVPAKLDMKKYDFKTHMDYSVFLFDSFVENETLDAFRNGITFIEDLKGVSLKNFDMKIGKKLNENITMNFPFRIGQILVLNPGTIVKVLLKLAKLFVKEKIINRVVTLTEPELFNYVDQSQLIKTFGGQLDFDLPIYLKQFEQKE